MTLRRYKRGSYGTTSQAFRLTKWSLLCLRPPSFQPDSDITKTELLIDWERKLGLSRKNTRTLLEKKMLVLKKERHLYYVAVKHGCEDFFKEYCLYLRKNHPAKKGKNRIWTTYEEMDAINKKLYPQWF